MKRDSYEKWVLLSAKYFVQYYKCDITYPNNWEDEESHTDGLHLYFYEFNWDCLISNYVLHYIHARIYNLREGLNKLKDYIAMRLERAVFTEKGLYYKNKLNKYNLRMAEDLDDIEFMRPKKSDY